MILLDTHVWLWWLFGDGLLKLAHRDELDRLAANRQLALSWVSVWEAEMLDRKGRIILNQDFEDWITEAVNPAFITLLSADKDVVCAQRKLSPSFHNDPADRLIAATSILSEYPLASFDRRIIDSGDVRIHWDG